MGAAVFLLPYLRQQAVAKGATIIAGAKATTPAMGFYVHDDG